MNVHLEIIGSEIGLSDDPLFIIWQGQYKTHLGQSHDGENTSITFFCPSYDEHSVYLSAFIGSSETRRESKYLEHHLQITESTTSLELSFDTNEEFSKGGLVRINYRCESVTNPDKVRFQTLNNFLFTMSIDYLNTLFEPPLEAIVHVYNSHNILMTKAVISNANHMLLLPVNSAICEGGLTLFFTERIDRREVSRSYRMSLAPLQTTVYSFPTTSNKIIVAEMNLLRKRDAIAAIYHSAVFREGKIVADGQQKARISLTPRRASSIHSDSPGLIPNISARQSVVGAVKFILYLNDESISVHQDSFASITEHILPAVAIPTKDIVSYNNTSDHSDLVTSAGRMHGTYMVCSSKSDVVEGVSDGLPKKGKSKRKALQNICLGLVKLDPAYATGPLKLRATVLKTEFSITSEVTSEGIFDTSKPLTYDQHISVAFVGTIKESSREIFNDTGLMSCTLEGTLLSPDELSVQPGSSKDNAGSNPPSPRREGETCMAFKVYMSLVNRDAEHQLHADSELVDDDNSLMDRMVQEDLHKRTQEKEEAQKALQEGNEYNRVDTKNEEDGELPGLSKVNIPGSDGKTIMEEIKETMPAEEEKEAVIEESSQLESAPSSSSPLIPPLSLDKIQQGSRSKLILHGLEKYGIGDEKAGAEDEDEQQSELPGDEGVFTQVEGTKPPSIANSNVSSKKSLQPDPSDHPSRTSPNVSSKKSLQPDPSNHPSRTSSNVSSKKSLQLDPSNHPSRTSLEESNTKSIAQGIEGPPLYSIGVKPHNAMAFAEMIRAELSEKQKMIEKLMKELDDKYDAIQLCGKDIRQLREEKFQLQSQIKDLQGAISENFDAEQSASEIARKILQDHNTDVDSLVNDKSLSNKTLLSVIKTLQSALTKSSQQQRDLHQQIQLKNQEISRLESVQQEYHGEKEEYARQNRYLQQIQRDITKIDLYRRTIKTQEKMIGRLQTVMESKVKSKYTALREQANRFSFDDDNHQVVAHPAPPLTKTHPHHSHRHHHHQNNQPTVKDGNNAQGELLGDSSEMEARQQSQIIELEDKVRALEEELAKTQQDLAKAAAAPPTNPNQEPENVKSKDSDDDDEEEENADPDDPDAIDLRGRRPAKLKNIKTANLKIDQLIAESISKDYRVQALEQQLETSARDSARELAGLRTKVFELEMTIATFSAATGGGAMGMAFNMSDDEDEDDIAAPPGPLPISVVSNPQHQEPYPHINSQQEEEEEQQQQQERVVVATEPLSHKPSGEQLPPLPAATTTAPTTADQDPSTSAVDSITDNGPSPDHTPVPHPQPPIDKQTEDRDETPSPIVNVQYQITRGESVIDIDRIPTPPEAK